MTEYAYGQARLDSFYTWYGSEFPNLLADSEAHSLVAELESAFVELSQSPRSESSFKETLKEMLSRSTSQLTVTVAYNSGTLPSTGNKQVNPAPAPEYAVATS